MAATTERSMVETSPVYPAGSRVNDRGHLVVGGCDVVDLAASSARPTYIYAEDEMRASADAYLDAFRARTDDFEVLYASKAAPITAIYRLLAEQGLSVDVASGGELHMALRAGFDPARIYMHGNNKTEAELRYAIEAGVGHVIVDSFAEIARLDAMLDRPQDVLIRRHARDPPLHPLLRANRRPRLEVRVRPRGWAGRPRDRRGARFAKPAAGGPARAHRLADLRARAVRRARSRRSPALVDGEWECRILNVGGGLGIAYRAEDEPPSIEAYVDVKVRGVERVFDPVPRILIEPGRSLVGNAGLTAYEIGTVKEIPGVRTYVSVNGGMSDNMRPDALRLPL